MIKVLFVCIHNSARSQMAQELLRREMDGKIEVCSAGLEPGTLNPYAVDVLLENGIDIRNKQTQSVFDLFKSSHSFNFVITVCDESSGQRCPIFPGRVNRLHWSFPDPSSFQGSDEEKLAFTREVFSQIQERISDFAKDLKEL